MLAFDLLKHLQAVELAPLNPDIKENQIRPPGRNLCKSGVAVPRSPGLETFIIENAAIRN